ncbi:MAG: hypothetical protein AAF721_23285 [Myxococcota bacterium]
MLALIPGDVAMPVEQLRLAVPGLAGIAGLLALPMIGAWLRLALEYIEWDRTGISRPRRISGITLVRAIGLSGLLTFFILTMIRAAGDLRELQAESPVVSPALQGAAVGIAFWALYAVCMSALRRDVRRRASEHRMGGVLRL